MTVVPLKHLASLQTSCDGREPRPYLGLEHLESGTGRLVSGQTPTETDPGIGGVASVAPGDVLFGKLRPYLAKTFLVDRPLLASTELMALRPVPRVEPRWLHYLLMSKPLVEWAVTTSEGAKMPRTSWPNFGRWKTAVPSESAQKSIADFLDAETARVDALIEKKRRMVELFDERFRAKVDHATSLGMPVCVRHLTSRITSGPRGWGERLGDDGVLFIRSADLNRDSLSLANGGLARVPESTSPEAQRCRVAPGDTVVGITGANTGWVGIIEEEHTPGFVSQHVGLLRPRDVEPRWLAYSLFSRRAQEQLFAGQYGGTKQQLSLEDLAELRVHAPAIEEQRRLVANLERAKHLHTRLAQLLIRDLALLREHRQALISAAVTGQMAIPGVTA